MHLVSIYSRKQVCDETPRDDGDDACFRNGPWRDEEEEDTATWAPAGACTSDSDKLVKTRLCLRQNAQKKSTPNFMLKSCFFSQDALRRLLVTTRRNARNNNNASSRQSVGWSTTIKHYFTFLMLVWFWFLLFFFISAQEHNKSPHLAKAKKIQLQTHAGPPYVIYTYTEKILVLPSALTLTSWYEVAEVSGSGIF